MEIFMEPKLMLYCLMINICIGLQHIFNKETWNQMESKLDLKNAKFKPFSSLVANFIGPWFNLNSINSYPNILGTSLGPVIKLAITQAQSYGESPERTDSTHFISSSIKEPELFQLTSLLP